MVVRLIQVKSPNQILYVTISKVQFIQNTVLCSDRYKQVTEALSCETWVVLIPLG